MRGIWGFLGLLLALAIVALVVKQQMGNMAKTPGLPTPAAQGESVRTQSQMVQEQVRQAMEAAMVPARTASEEQ